MAKPRKPDPRLEASPVRIARKLRGWSAEQLAHLAGVSRATVDRIERGQASDEDEAPQAVLAALGMHGQSIHPAAFLADATKHGAAHEVKTVLELSGGRQPTDYMGALIAIAKQRNEPDSVILHLASGVAEAPPNAGMTWWFARYLDAPRG